MIVVIFKNSPVLHNNTIVCIVLLLQVFEQHKEVNFVQLYSYDHVQVMMTKINFSVLIQLIFHQELHRHLIHFHLNLDHRIVHKWIIIITNKIIPL